VQRYEQFHDGYFEGIWVPERGNAHVYLATSDRRRTTVVLEGVVMVRLTGFKGGNIILDVSIRNGAEPSIEDIAVLYDLTPDHSPEPWERDLLQRVRQESLCLFEISSSYGGECLILAASVQLLSREQWIDRYLLSGSSPR
jgi:hypothetical protein